MVTSKILNYIHTTHNTFFYHIPSELSLFRIFYFFLSKRDRCESGLFLFCIQVNVLKYE